MTSTAWANPHQLHPWFRMPSHKRKDLSDSEEEVTSYYQPRRSLSPAPSPKRRRCDILENGMSQLTLDGRSIASSAPYILASAAPTIQYPEPPATTTSRAAPFWADAPYAPRVTQIPTNAAMNVMLPGSVEEPVSPETGGEDTEVRDVSMKGPSWYEIEKDRTSSPSLPSSSSSPPARLHNSMPFTPSTRTPSQNPARSTRTTFFRTPPPPTVVDAPSKHTGIVIVDLEDSDAEDENTPPHPKSAREDGGPAAPAFTISSALLDRLPKPHSPLGPLGPEESASNALVLYRPLPLAPSAPLPDESSSRPSSLEDADVAACGALAGKGREDVEGEDEQPMGLEEVPMEDTRPCTPMVFEAESVLDESVDEPMDIEML
ncbi:hypothetical protein C8Q80DRAFT_860669 [Daedaleopsis nitida]|nr:hypothetical protein C8Q80DRAFT_860669 [Daedaleopsis nitida]